MQSGNCLKFSFFTCSTQQVVTRLGRVITIGSTACALDEGGCVTLESRRKYSVIKYRLFRFKTQLHTTVFRRWLTEGCSAHVKERLGSLYGMKTTEPLPAATKLHHPACHSAGKSYKCTLQLVNMSQLIWLQDVCAVGES